MRSLLLCSVMLVLCCGTTKAHAELFPYDPDVSRDWVAYDHDSIEVAKTVWHTHYRSHKRWVAGNGYWHYDHCTCSWQWCHGYGHWHWDRTPYRVSHKVWKPLEIRKRRDAHGTISEHVNAPIGHDEIIPAPDAVNPAYYQRGPQQGFNGRPNHPPLAMKPVKRTQAEIDADGWRSVSRPKQELVAQRRPAVPKKFSADGWEAAPRTAVTRSRTPAQFVSNSNRSDSRMVPVARKTATATAKRAPTANAKQRYKLVTVNGQPRRVPMF